MIKKLKIKNLSLNRIANEDGWFLVSAIIMIIFLTSLGLAIMSLTSVEFQSSHNENYLQNAQLTAEAGVEQTIDQLNQNSNFAGYGTTQFFDNTTQGYGVFATTISAAPNNSSAKVINSTGKVYSYSDSTKLLAKYGVKVTVVGTASPGYSVISGPGGLILGGHAAVTNSTLYINGYINMAGQSTIGTQSVPATVYVADDWCPQGANPGNTYPTVCTAATQPIIMNGTPYIYGSVCATHQTSLGPGGNNIQGGNGGQGLEAGCVAPTIGTPTYGWQAQESAVTTTTSGTSGQYYCANHGSVTLPANLELTGANIDWGKSCSYDLLGNVYIPGNLTIDGSAQISVDNSLNTTQPVVLVGGTISVQGSSTIVENSSGTGIDFISIDSNSECGSSCTTITGTDLYNTQTFQTVYVGGSARVPGSTFDAYWGEVTLAGGGNIGSATGQTINMSGSGTVTFGTKLDSGTTTWTITAYAPYNLN